MLNSTPLLKNLPETNVNHAYISVYRKKYSRHVLPYIERGKSFTKYEEEVGLNGKYSARKLVSLGCVSQETLKKAILQIHLQLNNTYVEMIVNGSRWLQMAVNG